MKRSRLILSLSLFGILVAVAVIIHDSRPVSAPSFSSTLPTPPFADYLIGSGVVEASSGNIVIGTPVAGVIRHIDVSVGDRVKAGAALFEIDARDLQAQLITARARLQQARVARLKPQHLLADAEQLHHRDAAAIKLQELRNLRDEYALAVANEALARAALQQLQLELQRYTIRAPVTGTILQMKMRPGEYMEAASNAIPAMILGSEQPLNVRVDIDENVAARVDIKAAAVAIPRGAPQLKLPLKFAYLEPLIVSKATLTGLPTERTDRRILQLVYHIADRKIPLYVGQQLDVYLQSVEPSPASNGSSS